MSKSIAETCIYAIKRTKDLEEIYSSDRKGKFKENRQWKTGKELVESAKKKNEKVAIIFGKAETDSKLIFYGFLDSVVLGENSTEYTFSDLTNIPKPLSLNALIKKVDGKSLSDDYIRSYVICKTPDFILRTE